MLSRNAASPAAAASAAPATGLPPSSSVTSPAPSTDPYDRPSSRLRAERAWTVTINESMTQHRVLLNLNLMHNDIRPGSLVSIEVLKPDSDKPQHSQPDRRDPAQAATPCSNHRYVCIATDMPKDLKKRYATVEVFVAKHIADAFGMRKGTKVTIAPIGPDNPVVEASHVELSFKDQYLSRADMWRLAVGELADRTVYKGQTIHFLGTIKAQVIAVYVNGRKAQSAFFGRDTKPVFRSESARYVLFIQMAREMWDFDADGSGEIMFSKVVNGFLPALFKKWAALKVRHLVTIVLFARVEYDLGISTDLAWTDAQHHYYTGIQHSGDRRPYKDFYRVVVSEMGSGEWTRILHQLKREFNYFRKDISTHHQTALAASSSLSSSAGEDSDVLLNRIKAEASLAVHGNFLEAINMACTLYSQDYIDRDLTRTGISVVVISPGPGVFEVEYDALRRTTEALVGSGIGIDLICIPKIPLHSVPLFRYRNPHPAGPAPSRARTTRGDFSLGTTPKQATLLSTSYNSAAGSCSPSKRPDGSGGGGIDPASRRDEWLSAIPQWLHVSYWTGDSREELSYHGIALSVSDAARAHGPDEFPIRCRMYDLQMRSVMETNEIETKPLYADPFFPLEAVLAHKLCPRPRVDAEGNVLFRNTKVPDSLYDHVYGFQKFAPDRHNKHSERSLWKLLQEYDDSRAKLHSRLALISSGPARNVREPVGEAPRKHAEGVGANLLETTVNRSRPSSRAVHQTVPELSAYPHLGSERAEAVSTSSSSRTASITEPSRPTSKASSSSSSFLTTKSHKLMRHISLGNRGFGIAAPAIATAEVSLESVGASRSLTPSRSSQDLRKMPPVKPGQRSSSRLTAGVPATSGLAAPFSYVPGAHSPPDTPTRPVSIRAGHPCPKDPAANMLSGSVISTTLRPEPAGHDRDIQYSNAIRAEDAKKLYNSKLLAGAIPELPSTLSPTASLSPWLTVLNPSNPNANDLDMATLYSRWQHVFPRPQEMRVMKWKSLCSPASVPLTTEFFPSKAQFETEYQRQPYNVSQNFDDELTEVPRSRDELLRELVGLRLTQGFQIVVGPAVARAFGQKQVRVADVFSRDHVVEDGASIFMSRGNTIHQLSCVNGTEVEVNIFVRKPTAPSVPSGYDEPPRYKPAIRTLLEHSYTTSEFELVRQRIDRNWNYIDAFIAGHNDELSEHLRFWRARFVLIPVGGRRSSVPGTHAGDSEEEIRIEGIRKLAQIWQRYRYVSPSERPRAPQASAKKDPNPLDIIYKTEDASVVIAAELETLPLLEGTDRKGQLVRTREPFSKHNINLGALAEAIQQPVEHGGVRMQNRRWHFRLHYNCFIGSDMTSWLLENFEDLETREEAEALGNRLMASNDKERDGKREGGLFVHVEKRHPFRDGQYFYQISSEYAKPHPPSWFHSKRSHGSVPSTPVGEQWSRQASIHDDASPSASGSTTPTGPGAPAGKKPKVMLSRVIKYDVDHRKKSYRPEIIELHYDRLHNPDNCYHIRIDWMNVTAKLVEDALENWGREAAQYGLRLVEVPIAEASAISEVNPFRQPYLIKLAVLPPDQSPLTYYDPNSFTPQAQPGRHFYQKAILRKFDFVLDMEAASNFPSDVEVSYSWGKPDFKYTQYIHRSGTVLVQIRDDGHFLLLANRLSSSSRNFAAREREVMHKEMRGGEPSQQSQIHGQGTSVRGITPSSYSPAYGFPSSVPPSTAHDIASSPASSPLFRPMPSSSLRSPSLRPVLSAQVPSGGTTCNAGHAQTQHQCKNSQPGGGGCGNAGPTWVPGWTSQDAGWIKNELETFCSDANALEVFYREAKTAVPAPGPAAGHAAETGPDGGSETDDGLALSPALVPISSMDSSAPPAGGDHRDGCGDSGAVAEGNIPVLGLPPGLLTASSGAAESVGDGVGYREAGGRPSVVASSLDVGSRFGTPRPASPGLSLMAASQLLRRGSVQYESIRSGLSGLRSAGERDKERDGS
ncbi:hypothetical protein VTJ83DRAFT_4969 [Remersonia thermophila]|uniref:Vacuolar membrane-associated protein IML1 n=1 Tax=Remersonia thermophila TaxID=72144 RepID=A0ABR4DDN1_9PEZI